MPKKGRKSLLHHTITTERPIIPIVLAGGSGERLWPLSREGYPKSLLKLIGSLTLLQTTFKHIKAIPNVLTSFVIGNIEYESVIRKQLKEIHADATILLETEPHNTAVAAAIATYCALKKVDDPLLLILPIDHYIDNPSLFAKMISTATKSALNKKIILFGVKPEFAATDYGYIKKGKKLAMNIGYQIKKFQEKPSSAKAAAYLRSKKYYWNSGIFLFLSSTFLEELTQHSPKTVIATKKIMKTIQSSKKSIVLNTHLLKRCPNISIDEAILEKTNKVVLFPFKGGWHDLGNWNSLYDISKKDKNGNVIINNVITFNTKNSYLHSTKQLLVTSGLRNVLVVATKDVILIADREENQDIKEIVQICGKFDKDLQ